MNRSNNCRVEEACGQFTPLIGSNEHYRWMPTHIPLPPELRVHPFLYRDARDNPLGPGRLRGPDLARPFRGVRVPVPNASVEQDAFLYRCASYAPLLTDGRFFSHMTAARLWEAPLPQAFSPGSLLHVSSVAPRPAPRMAGVTGHQSRTEGPPRALRHGFLTSDAASSWLSLGALLPRAELVVVADHLVLDPVVLDPLDVRPFATIEELGRRLEAFHGRGARALHWALPLIRMGSESRCETLLRLLLLRDGLPEPALNSAVTDRTGRSLGRGDMVYVQWRTVVEYDGDQHRTSTIQYERDIHRLDSIRDAGWKIVRVRSRGLFVNHQETLNRVTAALRAGGWPG